MAAAKVPAKAPVDEPKAPSVDSVAQAFAKQQEAREAKAVKNELDAEKRAKVMFQRLVLAKSRGGTAAAAHAIKLNAKDMGMEVADYRRDFEAMIKAAGL